MIEKHAIDRGNDKTIEVWSWKHDCWNKIFAVDQRIGILLMRYLAKMHENRIN